MLDDDNLFNKPVGDWSDDELRVGLEELAAMIQWNDDQQQHDKSSDLRAVWETLDDERRKRVELARDIEEPGVTAYLVDRPGEFDQIGP